MLPTVRIKGVLTEPEPMSTSFSARAESELLAPQLAALIERFTGSDGAHSTAIEGLTLYRFSRLGQPFHGVYQPSLCLIGQGRKVVMLGEERFCYDPAHFLLTSVDLPVESHIIEATPRAPYLSLQLDIKPEKIGALIAEIELPILPVKPTPARGLSVGCMDAPLLDASLRLLRLLEQPQHIGALAPLVVREISYLLLVGEEGAKLRRIAALNGQAQGIGAALDWLKTHFAEPFRLEEIARRAHMSRSGFHQHFKAVTAMTPLQYQKQLRLQEARRLMLSEQTDANTACVRVGYESASQFSREYCRLFGQSPRRDIARLRSSGAHAE